MALSALDTRRIKTNRSPPREIRNTRCEGIVCVTTNLTMADLQPGVIAMSTSSQSPVYMVASGDLRSSASQVCWPAQEAFENALTQAIRSSGREVVRAHPYDPAKGHGFIDSQRYGMKVFANLPQDAPLIVA